MKRITLLFILLAAIWLLWSGHFDVPFLLLLGLLSVGLTVWLAFRMDIIDDEGAPLGLHFRPLTYSVWLVREIIKSNIEVARILVDPKLPIHPRIVRLRARQKTELGRVILANSITLTPGTVSVDMQGDQIWVHALQYDGAEEDLSGDMNQRICELER